ncbi:MAG: hypothetical protein ACRDT6_16270 [Micromonosporaceae bacterium]
MRRRTKIVAGITAALALAGALTGISAASASDTISETECHAIGGSGRIMYCLGTNVWRGERKGWAYAEVKDRSGAPDYDVQVTNVGFQRYYDGAWRMVTLDSDKDGWWDYREYGNASAGGCGSSKVRARALLSWRYAGTSTVYYKRVYGAYQTCQ